MSKVAQCLKRLIKVGITGEDRLSEFPVGEGKTFFDTANRGIGLFISLIAAVALIVAGLLRAAEEL